MIKKTGIQPVECDVSTQLRFTSDSKYLWFTTKHDNTLVCLEMSHEFDLSTKYSIDTSLCKLLIMLLKIRMIIFIFFFIDFKDLIHLLEVSKCNKYVVAADRQSNIIVFSEGKVSTYYIKYIWYYSKKWF